MLMLLGGAVVGPFVGVTTYMLALQNCHVGVVTTILATIPVMILPFSVYLFGERVSVRAIGGALVAAAGVALLMLPVYCPPPEAAQAPPILNHSAVMILECGNSFPLSLSILARP